MIVGKDLIDVEDFLGIEYYDSEMSIYHVVLQAVGDGITCEVKDVSKRIASTRLQKKDEFFQLSNIGNGRWMVTAHTKQYGRSKIIPGSYYDRVVNFVHEYFAGK